MNGTKISFIAFFYLAIISTSGCAIQKAKGWDEYAKYMAAYDVLSGDCLALNENDLDYIDYRKAASKLLTVMEIDSKLYNDTYNTIYTNSRTNSREENIKWCEKLRETIVRETKGQEGDYKLALKVVEISRRERAEAWARALEATAAVAAGVNNAIQSANNQAVIQYIPMPSGQVTFGQKSMNNSNHYLINTPSGMRQCHVTNSGYIFCN
jgi:hypothetical protein